MASLVRNRAYQQLLFCDPHLPNYQGSELRYNQRRGLMLSTALCRTCGAVIVSLTAGLWERDRD